MFGEIIQLVPHMVGYGFTVLLSLLVGYHLREKRHEVNLNAAIANFEEGCAGLRAINQENLKIERAVRRELEISVLKCGESIEKMAQELEAEKRRADFNDGFRRAIVEPLVALRLWNTGNMDVRPSSLLNVLVAHAEDCVLNPEMSKRAKNLFIRGVRKGAKQGREQMAKLMQKSIDNQAATIESYGRAYQIAEKRRALFRIGVNNVLKDKIGLPAVRRSILNGIAEEVARLHDVEARKELTKAQGE